MKSAEIVKKNKKWNKNENIQIKLFAIFYER
jgi:hypothetical protein